MKVTVTGATGLIGSPPRRRAGGPRRRGHRPLPRPRRGAGALGVDAVALGSGAPAPPRPARSPVATASSTSPGENVAQRWTPRGQARGSAQPRDRDAQPRRRPAIRPTRGPRVLVSVVGRRVLRPARRRAARRVDAARGRDFLAEVCVVWEAEAAKAEALGMRVVRDPHRSRAGPVRRGARSRCSRRSGLGVGGPVAGGRHYMPWIHVDDVVGLMLAALDGDDWSGPGQRDGAGPGDQQAFSKALGRALHRPAVAPVPALRAQGALRRDVARSSPPARTRSPRAPLALGYEFATRTLDEALRSALGRVTARRRVGYPRRAASPRPIPRRRPRRRGSGAWESGPRSSTPIRPWPARRAR